MKVLHIAETIHGGIATYFDELLPLQVNEYGVDNVAVLIPREQFKCLECILDYKKFGFNRSGRNIKSLLSMARLYYKCINNFKPDVIHIHSSFAGFVLRLLISINPFGKRYAVIYCPHGWSFSMKTDDFKKKIYGLVERVLSIKTDAIICISKYEQKIAIDYGVSPKKMHVVYNGISEISPQPNREAVNIEFDYKKINILFVGRFHHAKGFDVLPNVFDKLGADFRLYVAGGAVLENERDFDVPDNIIKLGWLNKGQLEYIYENIDFVIIPSRWEGFGFVAIEALRAGKPILCSTSGALPEIVIDGVNGSLFENVDDFLAIENSIIKFIGKNYREMGVNGRRVYLKNFTSTMMAQKLSSIYQSVRRKECQE